MIGCVDRDVQPDHPRRVAEPPARLESETPPPRSVSVACSDEKLFVAGRTWSLAETISTRNLLHGTTEDFDETTQVIAGVDDEKLRWPTDPAGFKASFIRFMEWDETASQVRFKPGKAPAVPAGAWTVELDANTTMTTGLGTKRLERHRSNGEMTFSSDGALLEARVVTDIRASFVIGGAQDGHYSITHTVKIQCAQ